MSTCTSWATPITCTLALLDEVDLWRGRCANFEGKQELVNRLNELLGQQHTMRVALRTVRDMAAERARPDKVNVWSALLNITDAALDATEPEGK